MCVPIQDSVIWISYLLLLPFLDDTILISCFKYLSDHLNFIFNFLSLKQTEATPDAHPHVWDLKF